MIGFLKGIIRGKVDGLLILDVNGVGYEIHMASLALAEMGTAGEPAELEIHTHVSEQAFTLYGFATTGEKMLFRKLITVSGIGPKSGLAAVSAYPSEKLIAAIRGGDLATLTAISGIGKKTAERIVIELKDKFRDHVPAPRSSGVYVSVGERRDDDALQALLALGYTDFDARRALARIEHAESDTVQTLIKKSLGAMAS